MPIAANAFRRSFFGAGFPLFATQLFDNLGVEWVGSLMSFFGGLLLCRFRFCFMLLGERLRKQSSYAPMDSGGQRTDDEQSKSE